MVRILGFLSIGFSRRFDDGFRLTHPEGRGAKRRVNAQGVFTRSDRFPTDQPALAPSQAIGSTSPPLTQTSKWRWLAVERPVLPT